jgi:serine protease AprX
MKRLFPVLALAAALAGCQDLDRLAAPDEAGRLLAAPSTVDAVLAGELAAALPGDRLVAIATYDPSVTTSHAVAAAALASGAEVMRFRNLDMVAVLATPGQILSLAAQPGVQGVFANEREELLLRESVASIRADLAVDAGYTGAGVGVAIMDSGIDGGNPDVAFPGKTVANVKFFAKFHDVLEDDGTPRLGGELYVENLRNTDNSSGHGTHVAGIVAGSGESTFGAYRGVAPGAHLVGLSVGEGTAIVNLTVLQATDWLIDNAARYGIRVVNNSWGSNGTFNPDDPTNRAMRALYDAGLTVVFAAGNEGPGQNTMNRRSVAPWVISVAAGCKIWVQDPTDSQSQCNDGRDRVLANFSSRGIPGDPMYRPDVTAPGVRIVSTRSSTGTLMNALDANADARICNIGIQNLANYTCASGTSMSAPHVAGVIALMMEASGGRLTPDGAMDLLVRTAVPLPGYAEWEVGAGWVDALAAVRAAARVRK